MALFLVWILFGILIGGWSRSKGHGFLVAFLIAFFLSPLIAALIVGTRPARYRVLRNGATLGPSVLDPGAPRPAFVAVMILVITLAIVLVLGR